MKKFLAILGFEHNAARSASTQTSSENKILNPEFNESKFAQLEAYLTEDDNQGISSLAFYLYGG